jgi:hypothetical protein
MNDNSDLYADRAERQRLRWQEREERRRLRRERKYALRGQCDSLAHAIRGPITLITVGALFAINNFTPYGFDKTWPVILIVFGLLTLVGRTTEPVPPPAPEPPAAPPPFNTTPPAGSYRESAYSQPPAGSAPSEAAPRPGEQEGRQAHEQSGRPGPPHLGDTA